MSAPLRILIADDHAAFRGMVRSLLETFGAEVVECRDGLEALQRFRDSAPDWVLMDIEMPLLDGISATRQLLAASPQTRVLILTQYDDDDSREAAREAGACQFVPKDKLEILAAILFPTDGTAKTSNSTP